MKWLDSITDSILNQFWEMVEVREAWRAAVRGVAKSQTRLSDCSEGFGSLTPLRAPSVLPVWLCSHFENPFCAAL